MVVVVMVSVTGVSFAVNRAVERAGAVDAVPHDVGGAQFFGFHQGTVFGEAFPVMVFAVARRGMDIAEGMAMLHRIVMRYMGQG